MAYPGTQGGLKSFYPYKPVYKKGKYIAIYPDGKEISIGYSSEGERGVVMKTLQIGIASYDQMKAHTLAIARGEYKPAREEPIVWFPSVESFAKVLSRRNQELLASIARENPGSLTELAQLAGREKSNLSRTLKTLAHYGLVELEAGLRGKLIPRVPYDHVQLDVSLHSGFVLGTR